MNDLVYLSKLWLSIVNEHGELTTSDVLLASKRLVEGHDDQEIMTAIEQFEKHAKSMTVAEAIDYLNQLPPVKKYTMLINLFMLVILKKINSGKIERRQINKLKEIYEAAFVPFFFNVLLSIMDQKYQKAQRLLAANDPLIDFIYFDQTVKSESKQSFKGYQIRFVIMRIEDTYFLLNSHSSDLEIYDFKNDEKLSLQELCGYYKCDPFEFTGYNIRDYTIYYLNERTFIRISNERDVIYFDLSTIRTLFDPRQNHTLPTSKINKAQSSYLQCSIDKYHIYNLRANALYGGYRRQHYINKDVNFNISEGELVAIMGPSGSGKTTLLKTLINQAKIFKGELLANQQPLSERFFHRIGYVPQDDVLIGDLSVYDNMYYYYRLHFGRTRSDEELDQLITKQLRDLGILEIKHNQVYRKGKYTISGGQRKRLNIALELLKDVDLILMDEPTSGLSSLESEKIIKELKKITLANRIVIINVHQPSATMYKQFDQVIVLNDDGNNIYTDYASEVLKIFKLIQTEDIDLLSEGKASYNENKYERMDPELLLEIQANERKSFWNLFSYLNHFTGDR